ncbi:MAG: class I SAM-dependent methyltransferase [Polyangiales bacterium]
MNGDPFVFDDAVFDVDDYLYFYDETLRAENTPAQVDRVVAELALGPGARVLDLGCGHGRHALELARRGHVVTGVDRVAGFVERAGVEASLVGVDATFIHGDMRELPYDAAFDAAVCLFDAFGFHRDADNERVLAGMARALRPGGGFCLDLRNRDWMVRNLLPVTVLQRGEDVMIDRHAFDSRTGRLVDRRVTVRGGRVRETPFSVRLYAFGEIERLLREAGLGVTAVYGDWGGAPLSVNYNRMVIFGAKG